jgi:outer membrane lipoprotein SlyB
MTDRVDKERRIIGATIGAAFGGRIGATIGGGVSSLIGNWVGHMLRGWAARRHPAGIVPNTISQAQQL